MRIVFLGTPEAAVPSLEHLVGAGHELPLVVTQPDRPAGRSRRPVAPPVKRVAQDHGIQICQPEKIRTRSFRESIAALDPDLLAVVAYGRILSRRLLDTPRLGTVNVHFSLLPDYRGAAPVQWALADGRRETGVTTMLLDERMDEGDLLLQRTVPIHPGEHAPALEERMARLGAGLLIETVEGLEAGTITPRPQDHSAATYARSLTRSDGEIDPGLAAAAIAGRVRGFDPWPGAWVRTGNRRLRIVEARALGGRGDDPPGTVVELTADGLIVACGSGSRLLLVRAQPEGRKPQGARDLVNGRQLQPGDRLLPPGEA